MNDRMIKIHETVSRCRRCAGILDESRIIPRSEGAGVIRAGQL